MNFLFPSFLFGLAAISIPIIIHLFNFRRTKKVYFSSNEFLKQVKEVSSSRLKVKHLLILMARILFIIFLVIAFAQPYLPPEDDLTTEGEVFIYLDNSLSMSNEVDEELNALDAGVTYIQEIVSLFPEDTKYKVLTNDFAPFSNAVKSGAEVLDITTEMDYSWVTRSSDEIVDRLFSESVFDSRTAKTVFWISDFQRSTVAGLESMTEDTVNNFNLVPLQFSNYTNVLIDSIYLENPYLTVNENITLNVVLRNLGNQAIDDLIIKVFVNENQAANSSVSLRPGEKASMGFDLGFRLEQINKCRVTFEEYPVTFDNEFFFTLNLRDRIRILEIKGADGVTPVEKVYGNEELFEMTSSNVGNLDYNLVTESDLVILNSLESVDPSLAVVLSEFRRNGGFIAIVPSLAGDLDSYQSLIPGRLLVQGDTALRFDVADPDFNNPFFENVFEDDNRSIQMPWARPALTWGSDRSSLLSLRNGIPFLSSFGNTYLFNTSFSDDLTNFHQHALFVPVMYRMAALSLSNYARMYYTLDESSISVNIDPPSSETIYKLRNENAELIPWQRLVGSELNLEIPKNAIKAGFYELVLDEDPIGLLSFNYNSNESFLDQFETNELEDLFNSSGNVRIFDHRSQDSFGVELREKYEGKPLWKYALILALLFLLAEVLLIRFW